MKLNNIFSLGFSKSYLFLRIIDTNLINLGKIQPITGSFFLFQIAMPGERTKIPFIGLHLFGKTYEIGKRIGWSEEFEITNVRPISGNPKFPLILEGYQGEYSIGKATCVYADKSTSEKEVYYIHSLRDAKTGDHVSLPINYVPIYKKDGTKNLRPEPTLINIIDLTMSIRKYMEKLKGSLTP